MTSYCPSCYKPKCQSYWQKTVFICVATRHHWHQIPPNAASTAIEGYGSQIVQPKSLTGHVVLGYYKISDFSPPAPNIFQEICAATFITSYTTVCENRRRGITCRTFVLSVLSELCARGHIAWQKASSISSFVESLERVIRDHSIRADCSNGGMTITDCGSTLS
ncbi:hypothetical protein MIND_01064300 [Mycena indigotica]|uniref:Uncharacterized protein n=1 Tax=Mycena indigotica TaxID=2126181 RepID=A0A8H6W0U4_9AGAR|nr:uncharacterized protein MIND_01064300 [Mycena indigotica]KAF7295254.1 hypothetical protein MIND_01064300 [Mycena indigotica]